MNRLIIKVKDWNMFEGSSYARDRRKFYYRRSGFSFDIPRQFGRMLHIERAYRLLSPSENWPVR